MSGRVSAHQFGAAESEGMMLDGGGDECGGDESCDLDELDRRGLHHDMLASVSAGAAKGFERANENKEREREEQPGAGPTYEEHLQAEAAAKQQEQPEAGAGGGAGAGAGRSAISPVHTRSRAPARRDAIAQATQDFQGKCFIEQFHPDDNVRRKLNTGSRKGDLKKQFVYRVFVAREDARSHPSFSLGFFPIGKYKNLKRGWRKKVPWQPARHWINNTKYNTERDDVAWAPSEQVENAIRLTMASQAATWLNNPQADGGSSASTQPVNVWQNGVPLAMPEVNKRRG